MKIQLQEQVLLWGIMFQNGGSVRPDDYGINFGFRMNIDVMTSDIRPQ